MEGIVNGKPAIIGMYTCHNHEPYSTEVIVQNGWTIDGKKRVITMPNGMSKDCRYALHGYASTDARCENCTHNKAPTGA